MIRDIITIDVTNKHYKKMEGGYLRNLKIDSKRIAISINKEDSTYRQIIWKNILIDGHRIKKIILLKSGNLFLYIGSAADGKTIVFNEAFSEFILSISLDDQQIKADTLPNKANVRQKVNALLDKISKNGYNSLSLDERKQLNSLSKFLE